MPRSSKHKSHKQSKHCSKEARGHSEEEEEVVKTERSSKEDLSSRVLKDSGHSTSDEKRRRASQSREGRDGKDLVGYGNGNASEEYTSTSSKRRKEKSEGSGRSDRWNSGAGERGDDWQINKESSAENLRATEEKGLKHTESKSCGELKSKSSRRHESGCVERKEENVAAEMEKEEARSGRVESKRKSEKDSSRKENKDSKEKDRGSEKDKKQSSKLDTELKGYNGDLRKKLGSQSVVAEEKQGKRIRDNAGKVTFCS